MRGGERRGRRGEVGKREGRERGEESGMHKPPVTGTVTPTPLDQSLPNSPILLPPKPYLVLRDTLCSCEAYGMRPMYKGKKTQG